MRLNTVVNSPRLAEPFLIQRSQGGNFGAGGWQDVSVTLQGYGVVSNAEPKDVDALPDADRVHEAIVVHCEQALYVTRASDANGNPALSDLVKWQGDFYRVVKVGNYSNRYGYYEGICVRIAGD